MRIALISCSKKKKNYPCPARELYSASTLFSLSYQYATQNAERIYILSAKYGLVPDDRIIESYDQTLNKMSRPQQLAWASDIVASLKRECDLSSDSFILLAGNAYYRDLIQYLPSYCLPLDGLGIGERIAHLKQLLHNPSTVDSICGRLHVLFCSMPRYTWDQIPQIPFTNGIYIIFEKSEQYHGMERIVRVGTHTSSDRLKARLTDHFVRENHDGSILRKNIGKAILNARCDPYLETWTIDTSKPKNRSLIDVQKNSEIEHLVSIHLKENFSFTVFPVACKVERLRMEEAIIATLNADPMFRPSSRWLGLFSPEEAIRESGLWLKRGLNGAPLTKAEFERLIELCGQQKRFAITVAHDSATNQAFATDVPVRSCGKYTPLFDFLNRQTAGQIILTFSEMESILGFKLPNSAYNNPAWWISKGHSYCQAWLQAGFDITNVADSLCTKIITFTRIE